MADGNVVYIYGVVPVTLEELPDVAGVGDPPGEVTLLPHKDVAAVVSPIRGDQPLGKPDDLRAHYQLLNEIATSVPVLPLRFGAVLADVDSVTETLLRPYHDEFLDDLRQLENHVEFAIKGDYIEAELLHTVLTENKMAAQLRDQMRGMSEEASRDTRIALGELVQIAIAAKREDDATYLVTVLEPLTEAMTVREPPGEYGAVDIAVLVHTDKIDELTNAVGAASEQWQERMETRLLGPLAPFDFVNSDQLEK